MSSLWSEFLNNTQRPVHKWAHYFPAYEQHFGRYVNRPCLMIEIGVADGGSLQMWKRYLGPLARLVGIDIEPRCRQYEEDQISIRIGDQSDHGFLQSVLDEFGTPDMVLDDGSHMMEHVNSTFSYLYHRTSQSGVYMVEDMHTAYWEEFGGGLGKSDTFIEVTKRLIDELNADHTRGAMDPTLFTRLTYSMHIYDSIVAFERGQHLQRFLHVPPESAAGPTP